MRRYAKNGGGQEGQGRPLNPLITMLPNFPSSHSLTLTAVCHGAVYFSQKRCLVTTTRTASQTTVRRRSK